MVIPMRDDFRKANPDAAERLLKAHKEASLFAAANHDLVNKWFQEPELARQLSLPVIQKTTAFDPQWTAKSIKDIRVSFSEAELKRYLGLATRAHALKIYPMAPPLQQKLDLGREQGGRFRVDLRPVVSQGETLNRPRLACQTSRQGRGDRQGGAVPCQRRRLLRHRRRTRRRRRHGGSAVKTGKRALAAHLGDRSNDLNLDRDGGTVSAATGFTSNPPRPLPLAQVRLAAPSAPILIDMRMPSSAVETCGMPTNPRASNSLWTLTSRVFSSMPRIAAFMAMTVAAQEAMPARSSQPGLDPAPLPPIGSGMSLTAFSPPGPAISHRSPSRQTAVAVALGLRAAAGLSRNTRWARSSASRVQI